MMIPLLLDVYIICKLFCNIFIFVHNLFRTQENRAIACDGNPECRLWSVGDTVSARFRDERSLSFRIDLVLDLCALMRAE